MGGFNGLFQFNIIWFFFVYILWVIIGNFFFGFCDFFLDMDKICFIGESEGLVDNCIFFCRILVMSFLVFRSDVVVEGNQFDIIVILEEDEFVESLVIGVFIICDDNEGIFEFFCKGCKCSFGYEDYKMV